MSENHDSAATSEPGTSNTEPIERDDFDLDFLPQDVRDALDRIQAPADYNTLAEFYLHQHVIQIDQERSSEQALSASAKELRMMGALLMLRTAVTEWYTKHVLALSDAILAEMEMRLATLRLVNAARSKGFDTLAAAAFNPEGSELEQLDRLREAVTKVLGTCFAIRTNANTAKEQLDLLSVDAIKAAIADLNKIFVEQKLREAKLA